MSEEAGGPRPGREDWLDAAVEAERESGRAEETPEAAKAHILIRLGRMALGSALLLAGLVAMIGPGPGLLLIAAGLAVLARDVAWADRLLQKVRARLPADADGRIPRSTIVTMVVATLAVSAFALWWGFR